MSSRGRNSLGNAEVEVRGALGKKDVADEVAELLFCNIKTNTWLATTNTEKKEIHEPGSDSREVDHPLSRIVALLRSHTVVSAVPHNPPCHRV